jgi:hypothetical protein
LTEYYLDLETYSPTGKPNLEQDKIITIQFQELSTREGHPQGELVILSEWHSGSEEAVLAEFRKRFLTGRPFDFIPIGLNLYGFDLILIIRRLNKYFDLQLGIDFFRDRPVIDIKSILVIMNNGMFSGYQRILGKIESGTLIRDWYEKKDYDRIEKYVREEAGIFIKNYQILKAELPKIRF